jgi:hypothetical protein
MQAIEFKGIKTVRQTLGCIGIELEECVGFSSRFVANYSVNFQPLISVFSDCLNFRSYLKFDGLFLGYVFCGVGDCDVDKSRRPFRVSAQAVDSEIVTI